MAPGWGTAATSSVPPSARIWNCSSKSPDRLDLDVVVGIGVDEVVEDLLVGVDLLGLTGAHQVDGAGVLLLIAARLVGAAVVVVVAAASGGQHQRDDWHCQQSPVSHGGLLSCRCYLKDCLKEWM
jgi:hypothetical protein